MSYSQNKEDILVHHHFGDYKGRLLDLGANDGTTFSNSRLLIELGWDAVLVEPSPKCVERLTALHRGRGNVVIAEFAVGERTETATFHESGKLIGKDDQSLVSTLIPEEKERWKPLGMKWREYEVDVFSWADFYDMYPGKYDFVSIDCEGVDLAILRQMDLDAMGTRCLIVEWNGKDKEKFVELANGFKLLHENGENLIFVR